MNRKKIFVYVEEDCGAVGSVYFELLSKAYELNTVILEQEGVPAELCAVCLFPEDSEALEVLKRSGVDKIYNIRHGSNTRPSPAFYSEAIAQLCRSEEPWIFLIGATTLGTEIAPSLGVKLNTGVSAHCVDVRIDSCGVFVQVVPAFGGKVLGEILTPDTLPQIATIKPGLFQKSAHPSKDAQIIIFEPEISDELAELIIHKETHVKERDSLPVEKADVIICGGYGIGGKENWELLKRIADYFEKAAVGCTRPALDEGWAEEEGSMIGTSGKTVRPRLYIGAGISGAMHHVCGIVDSELIISINTNENAEIFKASNIKVVGDAVKILKALEIRLSEAAS